MFSEKRSKEAKITCNFKIAKLQTHLRFASDGFQIRKTSTAVSALLEAQHRYCSGKAKTRHELFLSDNNGDNNN